MGSECNPSKRHYDITMSKRTRKPSNLPEADQSPITMSSFKEESPSKGGVDKGEESSSPVRVDEGDQENDHKSLKQLINGNGDLEENENSGEGSRGRSSLGQHFTEEEKQLQLVRKQRQEGVLKLKGTVSRYVKVLSQLIKIKRDPRVGSRRKPVLQLTM